MYICTDNTDTERTFLQRSIRGWWNSETNNALGRYLLSRHWAVESCAHREMEIMRESAQMSQADVRRRTCDGHLTITIEPAPVAWIIFDIPALWRSGLSVRVPECQNYKWRLNLVWYSMLYSCCAHMATVGVKGLTLNSPTNDRK